MSFRPNDKEDQKKAYEYISGRCNDFWNSALYDARRNLYERRRDAFYMRPDSKTPKWRSRLTFATYFLGVKMLDAQLLKTYSGSPFVTVQLQPGSIRSPETDEKLRLANFDLNRDLNNSRFLTKFDRMRLFMELSGIGVARDYFGTSIKSKIIRSIQNDQFGMSRRVEQEATLRTERTVTDIIHPLNFAQEPTVHELRDARWSNVRFLLKAVDIYKMVGNKNYNQEDVKKILEQIEKSGAPAIEQNTYQTYYYDYYWDNNERTNNSVICNEYCGDLNYRGNYDDNALYHALWFPQYQALVRCAKSPFGFKNHWKICAYPDMEAPYGIDPCAMLLPVFQFNNDFMNQYMDYVRANMRVMYEMYDGNVVGGIRSILNGDSFGFVLADTPEAYKDHPNGLVRPVQKDKTGIPGLQDMVNYMDRYASQVQPASNLKAMPGNEHLDKTATGIGFQASREDVWVGTIRTPIDAGLQDGLHQKLENRINFSTEEQSGDIGGEQYRYYPFELGGPDYEYDINRQPPEANIGRIQQALQLANGYFQSGLIDLGGMAHLLKKMFELSGVPGAADMVKDPSMAPQIGGMGGAAGAAGGSGAPAAAGAAGMPPKQSAQPVGAGVGGALAAA